MRLKIIKPMQGEIDGIALDHFQVGAVYDVGTTLGSYLLALGAAIPIIDERPVPLIPGDGRKRRTLAGRINGSRHSARKAR